jgi:hypothetical protein
MGCCATGSSPRFSILNPGHHYEVCTYAVYANDCHDSKRSEKAPQRHSAARARTPRRGYGGDSYGDQRTDATVLSGSCAHHLPLLCGTCRSVLSRDRLQRRQRNRLHKGGTRLFRAQHLVLSQHYPRWQDFDPGCSSAEQPLRTDSAAGSASRRRSAVTTPGCSAERCDYRGRSLTTLLTINSREGHIGQRMPG